MKGLVKCLAMVFFEVCVREIFLCGRWGLLYMKIRVNITKRGLKSEFVICILLAVWRSRGGAAKKTLKFSPDSAPRPKSLRTRGATQGPNVWTCDTGLCDIFVPCRICAASSHKVGKFVNWSHDKTRIRIFVGWNSKEDCYQEYTETGML